MTVHRFRWNHPFSDLASCRKWLCQVDKVVVESGDAFAIFFRIEMPETICELDTYVASVLDRHGMASPPFDSDGTVLDGHPRFVSDRDLEWIGYANDPHTGQQPTCKQGGPHRTRLTTRPRGVKGMGNRSVCRDCGREFE